MVVGVITNTDKDPGLAYTNMVCDFLAGRGVTVVSDMESQSLLSARFWVVLGGDGTMLRHSHMAAKYHIPLLGINLGNLGFLTDVEKGEGIQALTHVLAGEYETENRLMLETNGHLALNDVYTSAKNGLGVFVVSVNGMEINTIRADGIIVATPTGSTAYNLSAGGPILVPNGNMMVITPVCPHCLDTRPFVIGADDNVQIVAQHPSSLIVDGENMGDYSAPVHIQRAAHVATIIKTTPTHLHASLRRKKLL